MNERDYVVGFFNDDGILDVATNGIGPGASGYSGVLVRFGNGDGTFQAPIAGAPTFQPVFPLSINTVTTGYFNRDAIADLAVTYSAGTSEFSNGAILLGNGDGTFRAVEGEAFSPSLLAVDDVNGDNIADLLIGNRGISVKLGRGDGTFRSSVLSFVVEGSTTIVGEFNGDGHKDFATTGAAGVSVALGYGDGTFQTTWKYGLAGTIVIDSVFNRPVESATLALGEFNGDGIKDLAVYGAGRLAVLLGNGDGSFRWAFDYPLDPFLDSGLSPWVSSTAMEFRISLSVEVESAYCWVMAMVPSNRL